MARTPSPESESKPHEGVETNEEQSGIDDGSAKDKFFIVKSLTVEDLELSVRNGIWATQSHNEEALNKAYKVRKKFAKHSFQYTKVRNYRLPITYI